MDAQVTVDSVGNVKLVGDLNIIRYNQTTSSIFPDETNVAYCGAPSKQFLKIYGQSIYGNGTYLGSDARLKENFRKIENPLSKILKMEGKKYDFIFDKSDSVGSENDRQLKIEIKKDRLGLVAQELMHIAPEAVVYEKEIDQYYIEYTAIIPIIIEAMKEQQINIEAQKERIEKLEKSNSNLKSATIDNNPNTKETPTTSLATLSQNIPNPFSNNTTIGLNIPSEVSKAVLYIYNMQGIQISSYEIAQRGATSITIEGYTLQAGMYLYTLIADGKEVDTKKMILTK